MVILIVCFRLALTKGRDCLDVEGKCFWAFLLWENVIELMRFYSLFVAALLEEHLELWNKTLC